MGAMTQALANTTEESLAIFVEAYRMTTGRPTVYNELIAAEIIDRLQNGETMRAICRSASLPAYSTVYDWMQRNPAFSLAIARARRGQATALVEEAQEIIDECDDSTMPQVQKADKRANLRIQLAKCFDRETYGDKVQQDINVKGVVIHTEAGRLSNLLDGD